MLGFAHVHSDLVDDDNRGAGLAGGVGNHEISRPFSVPWHCAEDAPSAFSDDEAALQLEE
jgi:hypothetical protein